MKPKKLEFKEYIKYYHITYEVLCDDFDNYLEYLTDEFWRSFFKQKNKSTRQK